MQELQAELGDRILCIKCDVSKEEDVKQAVEQTVKKFGTIHVALANAGIGAVSKMLDQKRGSLDTKSFQKVFNINVLGAAYTAKYCAVQMAKNDVKERGERGVILFTSS